MARGLWAALAAVVALAAVALAAAPAALANPGDTLLVSVPAAGGLGNNDSFDPAVSADGRYVAFASHASNLVSNDTNGVEDVFVRDRAAGTTTRVSVATDGTQANGASSYPAISADGRVVAFVSYATNLVPGGNDGQAHVFVHTMDTGQTFEVDVSSSGQPANVNSFAPQLSADGRYVAFRSGAGNLVAGVAPFNSHVYVYDTMTHTIEQEDVSATSAQANGQSWDPTISGDGNLVAFYSAATNLVPGDTNGHTDIFVRNRSTGAVQLVSRSSTGGPADGDSSEPKISSDGSTVAWASSADNVVASDTNGSSDVFATTLATGATERVSVSSTGAEATGTSDTASISADGRYVAFESDASNLVAGDTNGVRDVFVRDRLTGATTRESLSASGLQVTAASLHPSIDADGQLVAFYSYSPDLVAGDTNGRADVFIHQLGVADRTPPVVTGTADRPPNANGWYAANVLITWASVDPPPSSGTPTIPPPTVASTEGQNVAYTSGPSCDPNNNCATGSLALSIDKTPPTITATVGPPPNANGWNNTAVMVGFTCSDSLSGLASCNGPITLATEGTGLSATGTATDRAGNTATATASGIKIDMTPPTITFAGTTGTVGLGDQVSITCTATDNLSGIDTATCPTVSGPAYVFGPGKTTIFASATDKAGNQASAQASFVVQVTYDQLAALTCSLYSSPSKGRGQGDGGCKRLTNFLAQAAAAAAAGDTKRRDQALKSYVQGVADAMNRNFTPEETSTLTRMAVALMS